MSEWLDKLNKAENDLIDKELSILKSEPKDIDLEDAIIEEGEKIQDAILKDEKIQAIKTPKTHKKDSNIKKEFEQFKKQFQETIGKEFDRLLDENQKLREFKEGIFGLLFESDQIWELVVAMDSGQIRNWLTVNQPKSTICKRKSALDQIVNIFNQALFQKIRAIKKGE